METESRRRTRHVFVKQGCPWRQQSQNMAKISKSYIFLPRPTPSGMGCQRSVRNTIDEFTILQSKFAYCIITKTLSIALCKRDRITDGWTDKWTNGQTIQLLDAPGGPFRLGHKNNQSQLCTETGKSTLVSKICNIHDSASLVVDCKSLTLGCMDFPVPVQCCGRFLKSKGQDIGRGLSPVRPLTMDTNNSLCIITSSIF